MSKKNVRFILFCLFIAAVVALDQWTKYLVVENIPLYQKVEAIPGLFYLTYVQNTGAAFSVFEGMRWLFIIIFSVLTIAVIFEYFKSPLGFTAFDRWCIAAIYGGGLGNMLDRIRLGFVVDMIATDFMEFPVFNVADCFITCGCIAMMVSLVFFNKDFWKDEKKA